MTNDAEEIARLKKEVAAWKAMSRRWSRRARGAEHQLALISKLITDREETTA